MRRNGMASRSRGVSMIECVISVVIVSVMLTAALRTVGASVANELYTGRSAIGLALAKDLMSEILAQRYEDVADTLFGLELLEALPGNRSLYDDVDDYHRYTETPPRRKNGTQLTEYTGWTRSVTVENVVADTLAVSASGTGVKRITITASFGGVPYATLVALRTSAWKNLSLVQANAS